MDRTVWGYCRVSSVDQNLDRQKAAMLAEGIDEKHILCDKASGKDFERRTWNLLVGTDTSAPLLRKGDLLYRNSQAVGIHHHRNRRGY